MGRAMALASMVVGGLIIADLWAHYRTTSQVLHTIRSESSLLAGK